MKSLSTLNCQKRWEKWEKKGKWIKEIQMKAK